MKNQETCQDLCAINAEKLVNLLDQILVLYQKIRDYCEQVDEELNRQERPRKTNIRNLTNKLLVESFKVFDSIGFQHTALMEGDNRKIFEGIFRTLGVIETSFDELEAEEDFDDGVGDEDELESDIRFDPNMSPENAKAYLLASILNEIFACDKPINFTANLYIGNEKEE